MQRYYWKNPDPSSNFEISRFRNFEIELLTFARMPIEVRIVNRSNNDLPTYATDGSAGLDIRAFIESPFIMQPMQRAAIPTGIFIELPKGYEAQVRPRSGLALKQGITVLNTPGTIDSDYRGEIKIILINLSGEEQVIQNGERIAQLVIQKYEKVNWTLVEQLEETARNAGGFGHTGKH
jgi:dUTP pyrophosphatase